MGLQLAIDQLHALYQECVNCPNTEKDCPGIWRDPEKGVIPDGFYFRSIPADILVVGKNTGHPDESEMKAFAGLSGEALYKSLQEKQESDYQSGGLGSSPHLFSRKLAECLCQILDVTGKDLFTRIAFTNLVKCRTIIESGNKLNAATVSECFYRYLKHEVELIRPKVILALGRDAEEYLLRRSWRYLGVPVLYLKHPSRPLSEKGETATLNKLKEEIKYFTDRGGE